MIKIKILSCGDVHLTNYTAFNRPVDNSVSGSRLEYILKALDYFFDYGNEHNIHTFVINGDLFDQRQRDNPSTLEYIRYRIISKFRTVSSDNNFLYINSGNHDQATRQVTPSAVEHFDLYRTNSHFIQVMNKVTLITDYDFEYLFIPYSEDVQGLKKEIQKTLKEDKEKYPIYVFAHLGVDGAVQGRWNHRLNDAFNLDDLGWNDPRVRLITLGHFHTRQTLKKQGGKESFYQGGLTELNFNDIRENGLGAPRGFDEIDTVTGEHKFIDLTNDPYDLPTFNLIDFDKVKDKEHRIGLLADLSKMGNYIRITTTDKHYYEELKDKLVPELTQVVFIPPEHKEEMQVKSGMSDNKIVEEYCKKYYPDVVDEALDYLKKAKENQC